MSLCTDFVYRSVELLFLLRYHSITVQLSDKGYRGITMKSVLGTIMLALIILSSLPDGASAEILKGSVKAIAAEIKLFSLTLSKETVLLVSWNDKTVWEGLKSAAELKLDEILSVDVIKNGDSTIATSVGRGKTPLHANLELITLELLTAGLEDKTVTLVDTRAGERYDAGHIPGAASLPLARLEKRTVGILPESKNSRLVFYDEGQGEESAGQAAEIARRSGYTKTAIFPGGAYGWSEAGRPLAVSTRFIRKTRPVVIDLRSAAEVAKGHIEKAVHFPYSAFSTYFDSLPLNKFTPIVLYGESDKDAVATAALLRDRGYRRVTIYSGGVGAWLNNAEVLETGPASTVISSAESHGSILLPNDFEMALRSPIMVEIVDVRSASDHKKGGFPQAKHIPLEDLARKHGELNREKIQVIFAVDPVHAEMASDFLAAQGYRVNYLYGAVEFGKDGAYTVK